MKNKLQKTILELSTSQDIKVAVNEWHFNRFYHHTNHCICGQKIKENVELVNVTNGNVVIVGTNCMINFNVNVKDKFNSDIELLTQNYFNIKKNIYSSIDDKLIEAAYHNNIITDLQVKTYKKQLYGEPNWKFRKAINTKILNWIDDISFDEETINRETYVFDFGKYKGKTYKEVSESDGNYIKWVEETIWI